MKQKSFIARLLDARDPTSSKRLVTLLISAHFILASFLILFIGLYVIFYLPKGRVEPELLALLKEVLAYDFYIILSGLGFVTAEGIVSIIVEHIKAKVGLVAQEKPKQDKPEAPPVENNEIPVE